MYSQLKFGEDQIQFVRMFRGNRLGAQLANAILKTAGERWHGLLMVDGPSVGITVHGLFDTSML
jgi:hypothetical protein